MNRNELRVLDAFKKKGYSHIRGGSPDFVFFKAVGGEIDPSTVTFVEVKAGRDRLSYEQQLYKEMLLSLGARCVVLHVDHLEVTMNEIDAHM